MVTRIFVLWLSLPVDKEQSNSTLSWESMAQKSYFLTSTLKVLFATITAHLFVIPNELDRLVHNVSITVARLSSYKII